MVKISSLPLLDTGDVDGTEDLPVVKEGETMRTPASPLIDALAQPYVDQASTAAAAAFNAVGQPSYASTAAGLAATAVGATFWVDAGTGIAIVYRHDAGPVATEIGRFIKNMAASGASGLVGYSKTEAYPAGSPGAILQTVRDKAAADRTIYVRPDGSDTNDGFTNNAGGALLTPTKAIWLAFVFDCAGYKVTIQLADGTYTDPVIVAGRLLGAKDGSSIPLVIKGNSATPANVVISTNGSNALTVTDYASVLLDGVTCKTVTSGIGWSVMRHARLEHQNCRLDVAANEKILCQQHAAVVAKGPLTVIGNADSFCHFTKHGLIDFAGQTITFVGAPVFTTYLWGGNDASLNLDGATIVGTATGSVTIHNRAVMNVTGLTGTYLGGSIPQVDDGGMIIDSTLILARTFYVRPDGNDSNDGLTNTSARAFATITGAVTSIAKREFNPRTWGSYNPVTDNCTIQVAAGTYNETVYLRDLKGYMGCTIKGDEATPGNVVVNGVADCFIAMGIGTKWAIKGLKMTAAGGSDLRLSRGTHVTFQNVDFGTATGGYHILAEDDAFFLATGNYTISGGAGAHILMRLSRGNIADRTITLVGTPAFTSAFIYMEDASALRAKGTVFAGTGATGKRHDVRGLSNLNTNGGGANFFPGDTAGTTTGAGNYI